MIRSNVEQPVKTLTSQEAADHLGVSRQTILRLVQNGTLRAVNEPRTGSKIIIREFLADDVERVRQERMRPVPAG